MSCDRPRAYISKLNTNKDHAASGSGLSGASDCPEQGALRQGRAP